MEHGRSPLLARLSLLLLMGVAGCTAGPGEGPLLAEPGDAGTAADGSAERGVEQWVRMGQRSLAGGDASTAIGLLEQALAREPNNREAALLLGYAHLAVGAHQDAGSAFGRILRRNPDDREAGVGYAKAMIAIGRSEAALEHLQPIVRRRADDVEALNLMGVAYDLQGEHLRAIEAYRRALAVRGDAPDVTSNLGLSFAFAGRHDEAVATLRPLAEGYVSSARNRQNLALAYGLAGQLAEAERWSRMDLSQADVENNLRYFQLVRGMASGAIRTAALQPSFTRPMAVPAPEPPRLADPRAVAAPAAAAAPAPAATAAPPPASRLPTPLTPRAGFSAGDAAVGGIGVDVATVGGWFVDLGPMPEARWRVVRDAHPAETAALFRLAPGDDAEAPFIVGPLDTGDQAAALCSSLAASVDSCTPLRL